MSDELFAMVRAAARDEAAAAEREFPYSPTTLGRFVRDVRRRRAAGGAMLAVAGVAVVGMAVLGLGRPWQAVPPAVTPTPSASASPDSSPTPTPTPTVDPTPTPSEIPTATPTPPAPEETTPPPPVEAPPAPPGAVTVIHAEPGGGSGEISVIWDVIADATGYRVYRADAPEGPFAPAASIDVTTGEVTIEYGGWYEYIQIKQGSEPASLAYTEAIGTFGYFRVTAFNAGGEGPMSVTVCSEPMTGRSPEFPVC